MRLGITAALTDRSIDPGELGRAAEERGFASLYLPEHTHLPVAEVEPPALVAGVAREDYRRTIDPLIGLTAAAMTTTRIALGTGVCLVAQHDPIVLAKQIATLDQLSHGRVTLGVGFGWNRQEAADHGVAFGDRRDVAAEKMRCMASLWTDTVARFEGRHVRLPPSYSWPKPRQQPRVRTLVGGGAGPRLFAAIAGWADGWLPIGGRGVAAALPALHRAMIDAGRDPADAEVIPFGTIPDAGKLEHFHSIGVREVVLRVASADRSTTLRSLDALVPFLDLAAGFAT